MSRRCTGSEAKGCKKKRRKATTEAIGLEGRVGAHLGFGIEGPHEANSESGAGLYGSKVRKAPGQTRRLRKFNPNATPYQTSQRPPPAFANRQPGSHKSQQCERKRVVHIVCAISENLARETCVASLDAGSPISLRVTTQGNELTYAETLSYLEVLQPDEILLNEGRRNSHLARKVLARFTRSESSVAAPTFQPPDDSLVQGAVSAADVSSSCHFSAVVKVVPRVFFDQTKGADLLRRIVREDFYDASLVDDYILLSSSHAVLHYTQVCLGANFSRHCLQLDVGSGGVNRMILDRSSLLNLELLANARTGKVDDSLIGTIDCTKTTVGSRLLRSNLMAPQTCIDTINARLDLVETILQDETFFYTLMEHLASLPDADRMLTNVALTPWKVPIADGGSTVTARTASKGISALVYLKTFLTATPRLAEALEAPLLGAHSRREMSAQRKQSTLLQSSIQTMKNPALQEVLNSVESVFTASTAFTRNVHAMKHQECFALKPKTDGMMDIIRKAFLSNVDDIYRLADDYAKRFDARVAVKHTSTRGYFLSLPAEAASDLPDIFVQPVKAGRNIHCSTEEVRSLNTRAQENVRDLLLMTHERIQEALDVARANYDALASVTDAIALLDMCHSFADNVASSRLTWCRPALTQNDGMTILQGRYAVDAQAAGLGVVGSADAHPFVPNDTYAPLLKRFTVLSGLNGSGKSTYLKQIAVITVLAHIGSYVPAEKAIIPICDRVATRLGATDDQEHNISSFMMEMKDAAFLCRFATDKSLILIDELGRATSNEDGIAIAWAVSEHLIARGSMTFFVSHYPQMNELGEIYPVVQNQHMTASLPNDNESEDLSYLHKIMPGACGASSDYGIEMSRSCGWPEEVVTMAKNYRAIVQSKMPKWGMPLFVGKQSPPQEDGQPLTSLRGDLRGLFSRYESTDGDTEKVREELEEMAGRKANEKVMARSVQLLLADDEDQSTTTKSSTESSSNVTVSSSVSSAETSSGASDVN